VEEIQRKIEEIKRQIAMMDVQKQVVAQEEQKSSTPSDLAPSDSTPSKPHRGDGSFSVNGEEQVYVEEYEEEVTETENEGDAINHRSHSAEPPQSPAGRSVPTSPSPNSASPWRQKKYVASPPTGDGHHDASRKQMEDLKQKFSFERPGWAAPAEVVEREGEIDKESIQNPNLKQAQMGGYQRQVTEKDIDLVKGSFVKDTPQAVEPRLAWIVVNLGKRKVGKIVMHLYGRDVHRLVDQFLELKGHELTRSNPQTLAVVGMDPALHVLSTRVTSGLDSKGGVFGIIQEGHDVFESVMEASDVISVKQAHIYPVVKGKKEFAKN
jgi:hypothetical protein